MPSAQDRRDTYRVPLKLFLNEYMADRLYRGLATNVSPSGLYVHNVLGTVDRPTPVVQLEFELPGTGEAIWAKGEIRYDVLDRYVHGTGIHFTAMASRHARILRDYVVEKKKAFLVDLLARVRRNRYH